jgi:uncharacterized membrane protein
MESTYAALMHMDEAEQRAAHDIVETALIQARGGKPALLDLLRKCSLMIGCTDEPGRLRNELEKQEKL